MFGGDRDYCTDTPGGGGSGDPGDQQEPGSPIVFNLDNDGDLRFTSAANGVLFDIDGDNVSDRVAWNASGTRQAFLFLDRNTNGVVDDGTELFGDATLQEPSPTRAPNGFRALLLFDQPEQGGNGDQWITAGDRVFAALGLWLDRNHNGLSEPGETFGLRSAGYRAIDLSYHVINRRDRHGNMQRYVSFVTKTSGEQQPVYDVFLQVHAN